MGILDLLFPKFCVGCGKIGLYICDRCKKDIIPIAPNECICPMCKQPAIAGMTHPKCKTRYALDGLTSFFYFKGVLRRAIHELKYKYVSDACREFMNLVPLTAYEIRSLYESRSSAVVPIPLHPAKLRYRGFNQSERLGIILSERLRIVMRRDILSRTRDTRPQAELSNDSDRAKNIRNAFTGVSLKQIQNPPKTAVLFDDVFTTGSTMREAGSVLKRCGFETVWAVTMAR